MMVWEQNVITKANPMLIGSRSKNTSNSLCTQDIINLQCKLVNINGLWTLIVGPPEVAGQVVYPVTSRKDKQ
jgi:hypothetical protein